MDNTSTQNELKLMSPKEWALTIFLSGIPLVGIILMLIWAFDSNTDLQKKNWAKGMLLLSVIAICVLMLLFFLGGLTLFSLS